MKIQAVRSPKDYRSLGLMLDRNKWDYAITLSLWWWEVEVRS